MFFTGALRWNHGLSLHLSDGGEDRFGVVLGGIALEQNDYAVALKYLEKSLKISSELNLKRIIIMGLDNLARLSCSRKEFVATVHYWANTKTLRQEINEPFESYKKRLYEQNIASARQNLNSQAFNAAWEAGRKMTLEEAVAYALN